MSTNQMQDDISYQIILLAHAHRQWAETELNRLGLYTAQEHILFLLWEEDGLTATQLASRFKVGLATIVKSIQRMERAGLVIRRTHPADRRAMQVYLTDHGRSLYAPAKQVWSELAERTVRGMTDIEQVLFRRLLQQAYANLIADDDQL